MWYVITKLAANCKDDVYLIKMVNFKVVVLFIKILTFFTSHRTFGNVIYDIVRKYSQLSTSKLRKLKKLSIKLKKADLDIIFYQTAKFLMLYRNFWRLIELVSSCVISEKVMIIQEFEETFQVIVMLIIKQLLVFAKNAQISISANLNGYQKILLWRM